MSAPRSNGHPAQDLGRGEVLRIAADLPDALIGVAGVLDGGVDQRRQPLPDGTDDLGRALSEMHVDRVEEHAPDVVLVLVPCPVADPDRPGRPPSREVVEELLGEILAPVDAVHDLQGEVTGLADQRLEEEREVLHRLPGETEAVERAQHERRVADPRVAIVPVALATRSLGQGRGGRGHDGAGRRVAEALEGQRAPLDEAAPRMIRKRPAGQPVPPIRDSGRQLLLRLFEGGGMVAPPGEGGEHGLTLLERRAAVTASTHRTQPDTRDQGERGISTGRPHGHRLVAVTVVGPGARLPAVVEDRHRVDDHLHPAFDAGGQAQEGARRGGVAGRTPEVGAPPPVAVRLDHEQVLDQQPPARRVPRRLEHHRPRDVVTVARHLGPVGAEADAPGGAIEQGTKDAGRVGSGEAQPLDRPVGRDEAAVLAVRQEGVIGDGREGLGLGHGCGVSYSVGVVRC